MKHNHIFTDGNMLDINTIEFVCNCGTSCLYHMREKKIVVNDN